MSGESSTEALVDVDRLVEWLRASGPAPSGPIEISPLTGGASNAMFVVRDDEHEWVLRRPAKVAIARADEGMRREFHILRALADTDVPHPEVVALCEDHGVLGCTFYLMRRIDGFNPMPGSLPVGFETSAKRTELTFAMVDALARLHEVDWRARGLSEFDRTDGFHERQVARWKGQLDSYGGRELAGTDSVITWLEANVPGSFTPAIMHGDYHMMNVLLVADPHPRVSAILDWETATIGDPLLDLAGFGEIWTKLATPADGWPTRAQIVERYCERRNLAEVPDLRPREVLYNFRMGVLLEGIYQRSLRDPTRGAMESIGEQATRFMERASELADRSDARP